MYLNWIRLDAVDTLPPHVSNLPFIHPGHTLHFDSPITIVTGDNGSGKSTLLEAIAHGMGANVDGGSRNTRFASTSTKENAPALATACTFGRGRNPRDVFFLRAETRYSLSNYYASIHDPHLGDLDTLSHGESVMAIVRKRFGQGLLLLDEPEDGLSVRSQQEFAAALGQLADAGTQVIAATHSPIIMATPGAQIWELSAEHPDGLARRDLHHAEAMVALREFLADPDGLARYLIGEEE